MLQKTALIFADSRRLVLYHLKMKMPYFQRIILALMTILTGCATANFDPTKPIEDGTFYRQNGVILDRKDLIRKLKDNPKSNESIQMAEIYHGVGSGFSIGGGLLLGTALGLQNQISSDDFSLLLGGGATFVAVSLVMVGLESNKLREAVAIHNEATSAPSNLSKELTFLPYLSFSNTVGSCGLSVRF